MDKRDKGLAQEKMSSRWQWEPIMNKMSHLCGSLDGEGCHQEQWHIEMGVERWVR